MCRVDKFKPERDKTKFYNQLAIGIAGFIAFTILSYAYCVDKENDKMRDFILNFDKDRKVYYLQQELFGGLH